MYINIYCTFFHINSVAFKLNGSKIDLNLQLVEGDCLFRTFVIDTCM